MNLLLLLADDWPPVPVARTIINICRHSYGRSLPPSCVAQPGVRESEASSHITLSCWRGHPCIAGLLRRSSGWRFPLCACHLSHTQCRCLPATESECPIICITGISGRTKSPIVLPPFPNIRTRAVPSNLKEGRILASVPACMPTCKRLQNAGRKWSQKGPYRQYYRTEQWNLRGIRNSSPSEMQIMKLNLEVQ